MDTKQQLKELKANLASLAAEEARSLQQKYPELFSKLPVKPRQIIEALEWELLADSNPVQRGISKYDTKSKDAKILYDRAVSTNERRFVISHEIGHALLLLNHPEFQKRKRSEERRGGKECRSRWSPYH